MKIYHKKLFLMLFSVKLLTHVIFRRVTFLHNQIKCRPRHYQHISKFDEVSYIQALEGRFQQFDINSKILPLSQMMTIVTSDGSKGDPRIICMPCCPPSVQSNSKHSVPSLQAEIVVRRHPYLDLVASMHSFFIVLSVAADWGLDIQVMRLHTRNNAYLDIECWSSIQLAKYTIKKIRQHPYVHIQNKIHNISTHITSAREILLHAFQLTVRKSQ